MALAIFDLDNTLLAGDSDHAFGEFLVTNGHVDAEHFKQKNDYFYQQYLDGGLNIHEYVAFVVEPLNQFSPSEQAELHQQFMLQSIEPIILPKALTLLQKHRDAGDFILIITATNSFITAPIARALKVDDLLATDPECINGKFTGNIAGTPCFQEGKVERLEQWLEHHPYEMKGSYFYSDSHNDLPLLKQVDHAIAVDCDDKLGQYARKCNWPIISLRD